MKAAPARGRSLHKVVLGHRLLGERGLARVLSPPALTRPRAIDVAQRRRVHQRATAYRAFRAALPEE